MEIKSWRELNKRKKRKKVLSKSKFFSNKSKPPSIQLSSDFKSKQLNNLDKSEDSLMSFYKDKTNDTMKPESPNIMSPTRKRRGHKSNKKNKIFISSKFWWLAGFIVLVALVIAISAWRWAGPSGNSQELELTISGPTEVALGEEAVWTVNYKNVGRVDLLRMELTVKYPEGLKIRSTEPAAIDSLNRTWDIGELKVGQSGTVEIRAQIFGEEGESKKFTAEMIYQPANFSSDFVVSAEHQVSLGSSQLSLEFTGPEATLPETENNWQLRVKNISGQDLEQTVLRLSTSQNFRMRESEPEIEEIVPSSNGKMYIWPKRLMQQEQELVFTWNGKFFPEAKGIEEMKVEIVSYANNQTKVLQEETLKIPILGEELALDLTVNDSKELAEVSSGSQLNYKITIHNTSGQDLKDLTVSLQLTPDYINWSSLVAPAEPAVSVDGLITLTSEKYKELALIKAGEKLEFEIKVRVKDQVSGARPAVKAAASVKVGMVGDKTKNDLSFSTRTIVTDIKVPIKLYVQAQYYDDEGIPVGSGPIPPRVGETTEYVISLSLGKTSKSFDKILVSAILPAEVNWIAEEQVDRGIFGYVPSQRRITWELSNIDGLQQEVSARFRVEITPQAIDVSKALPLLSVTSLSGQFKDGGSISLTAPGLDTNLSGALYGSGQGEVLPAE